MPRCALCNRDLADDETTWRNPLAAAGKDENGFLQLGTRDYKTNPGQVDPGAAPYCRGCIERMDAME